MSQCRHPPISRTPVLTEAKVAPEAVAVCHRGYESGGGLPDLESGGFEVD
jgi:hypothetical protein